MKGIKTILILLVLSLITLVFVTACWDYMEVERRGYVLGVAIDKTNPLPRGQEDLEEYLSERDLERMKLHEGQPKYAYTIQIPVIPEAIARPEAGGGAPGAVDRTWDLTIEGNNFFEVNRQFSTRLNYPPFYEHLKVIVISEEVARDGIIEVLDMFLRDHEMRRRTKVFVTPLDAKSILDVSPRIDDYTSLYLDKLPLNASKTSRMPHKTDLGEVSKSLHNELDFVLPRIIATKDEIKYAGAAVFKGDEMIGWLGELDTNYTKWVRDAVLGGIEVVSSPHNPDELVVVEITEGKTNVIPRVTEGSIVMEIEVEGTFNLVEEYRGQFHNIFDRSFKKKVEEKIARKLEKEIYDTIHHVQETFGADIFHFNVALQRYEPRLWEEIQENWHDIFPNIEVEVKAEANIRLMGLTK
ncbi:spore germination protein [Natronincola peptidivorans]|uniref:Spore germination protein n=1 Tax=Natronincola peptidivorans TaxID=426128 RepID=A0A1I0EAP4_9FIRM|nr:Ger(x)C family spore germination protein [Natronincola peptidivorans]SET42216.1 spore germination protein [Natronincola peptidivorans]